MKSAFYFVMISMLPIGAGFAQSTTTGSTNRRQALYDQYNSYSTKPASSTASSAPVATELANKGADRKPLANSSAAQSSMVPTETQRAVGSSGVRIGFRGGITYIVFTDTRPTATPGLGFVGGVTFTLGKGIVSFQPEVNYARYTVRNNSVFGANTQAVDNVEMPLFLKIATGTYAKNRFFINVGPYASYTASTSIDGKKVDVSNTKGRFGFGAAVGVGVALKAGPGHVTIEGRGLYSLGNTYSGFNTDSNTILGQATLGYIFPLGSR